MGLVTEEEERKESMRKKRKEYAAKRLALGFKDKKEEVDDKILEELEYKTKQY